MKRYTEVSKASNVASSLGIKSYRLREYLAARKNPIPIATPIIIEE